jgi:L-lactate dehydrogenase complex protein LldG
MSNARDAILAKLRAGDAAGEGPVSDFSVISGKSWSREEKIARLESLMVAVNTEFHRTTEADWPALVARLLEKRAIPSLLIGTDNQLIERLQDEEGSPDLTIYDGRYEDRKAEVFEALAALTTTRGAIAETGSLILWPNEAEPRLLSLVPPLHIALLDADRIYDTLWWTLTEENLQDGMPTNVVLISGPSKTADIEQELTFGVHGPKELIVLVIDG